MTRWVLITNPRMELTVIPSATEVASAQQQVTALTVYMVLFEMPQVNVSASVTLS